MWLVVVVWAGVHYLVIVVIQIRIRALKLHHLDSGDPLFLSLSHQIAVGVSVFPFQKSSPHGVIPERTRRREAFTETHCSDALSWTVDGTHPVPLFSILWFSILRCCGWRWVVLCRIGAWPRGGPWGTILGPDCPKKGLKLATLPCNNGGGGPGPRWNWPTYKRQQVCFQYDYAVYYTIKFKTFDLTWEFSNCALCIWERTGPTPGNEGWVNCGFWITMQNKEKQNKHFSYLKIQPCKTSY